MAQKTTNHVDQDNLKNLLTQIFLLIGYLYLFLFSIDLMGSSMKMFGKDLAETLITGTSNPLVGLFIGILATSLIQSSSTTTSMVVGLVGGGALTVSNAIPIIMGANIGTSVTNTLVALANINRSNEFRRSFSASIVHDFFNFLAVLTLFPLQYFTNYLGYSSGFMSSTFQNVGGMKLFNPLKAVTRPLVDLLKEYIGDWPVVLLIIALICLFFALKQIVGVLRGLIVQKAEGLFDKVLFRSAARAFLVGLLLTVAVQSSSITTSLVIPLAGAGMLTLQQIYPYTLGANIGTTVTAMLASLVTGNISAVQVAFAHLLFNISGIVIWWPLGQLPITLANRFSTLAMRNRFIPFVYILVVFIALPLIVILLF